MTNEEKYEHYLNLILKWKESAGLTSIGEPDEIRAKHFEDSKEAVQFLHDTRTLIDIGSGAGLPGIPIKIECPRIHVMLLDSKRKKINFLRQVIFDLNLDGVEAFQGRAEDPEFFRTHGPYDAVISRATWPLEVFLELAIPYFDQNGFCIAMKGSHWADELKRADLIIKKYRLNLAVTHTYKLSSGEKRCILIFKK